MQFNSLRLFSYKMTDDQGFAPNPFRSYCTLATCKPLFRQSKKVGDWIAGFTSKNLNGDIIERLIYLMKVDEKLELKDYFIDKRFQTKKPDLNSKNQIDRVGDNVYEWNNEKYVQIPCWHCESELFHDVKGTYVLIAKEFYYFGSKPISINDEIRPEIPINQTGHGYQTKDLEKAKAFIATIKKYKIGVHAKPSGWPKEDESWNEGVGLEGTVFENQVI